MKTYTIKKGIPLTLTFCPHVFPWQNYATVDYKIMNLGKKDNSCIALFSEYLSRENGLTLQVVSSIMVDFSKIALEAHTSARCMSSLRS